MKLRSTVTTSAPTLQPQWSHRLIKLLFERGRELGEESYKWFMLPLAQDCKKDEILEIEYAMCFITELFESHGEEKRNLFIADFYKTMEGKISQQRFITETFAFPEKQIRSHGKYRYTMVNFSPVYRESKPNKFLQEVKKSFIADDGPPLWALEITKGFFKSELQTPSPGYLSSITISVCPSDEIELLSGELTSEDEIDENEEFQNHISYIVTPEKIEVIAGESYGLTTIEESHDTYSADSIPLVSPTRINFYSNLALQSTEYNGFNDQICSGEPMDASTRYDAFKNGICHETTNNQEQKRRVQFDMQDLIAQAKSIDSINDKAFEASLIRRLQSKPDLLKIVKDSDIIYELICRHQKGDQFIAKKAKEGRVRYLQTRDQMTQQRLNELNSMLNHCVQAITQLIHPDGNYCLSEVSNISRLQEHAELSNVILRSIAQMKPRERRPQLSYFTTVFSKPQVERMLVVVGEGTISHREWTEARKHAKYPGVGKPMIPVFHKKCRVSNQALISLNEVFSDSLQRTAFGTKNVKLEDGGMMATIANVKTNKKIPTIEDEFRQKVIPAMLPFLEGSDVDDLESSCCEKEDRKGLRCRKDREHEGNCKFLPSSAISEKTIRRILKAITAGECKSLAGLDDDDVEKGAQNFLNLRTLVNKLSALTGSSEDTLLKDIDEAEKFHQADFILHFKGNEEKYKCACLPCGFDTPDDHIECTANHLGVCNRCFDSFTIFSKIDELIERVRLMPPRIPSLEDDIAWFTYQLDICRQNLLEYRAHLVLKYDEREADKEELLNLQKHQCIIVCDWKMKILPMFFRETQQQFFGKRGTSMIGFMVIYHSPDDDSNEKQVEFHFFLTDDSTQDSTSVNAAKHLLYKEFLPSHVKEVFFRADGAGCFSSNISKTLSLYWDKFCGIKEVSNRQSPAGGGKTNLDGMFGVFQRHLKNRVAEGRDVTDSASIIEAFKASTQMKATSCHIFDPDRSSYLNVKLNVLKPTQYYSAANTPDGLLLKSHSRFGSGKLLTRAEIHSGLIVCHEDENGISHESKIQEDEDPPSPKYILRMRSSSSDLDRPSILKGVEDNYLEREENGRKDRVSKNNQKIQDENERYLATVRDHGLYPCPIQNNLLRLCKEKYQSQGALDRHIASEKHKFPSVNARTKAAVMATAEDDGVLSAGKYVNRSHAVPRQLNLHLIADETMAEEEKYFFKNGCYNRPERKKATRMSDALKNDLREMFDVGLANPSAKISATKAQKLLEEKKTEDGRFKYSHNPTNLNGKLPSINQIAAFFSQEKNRRSKPSKDDEDDGSYEKMKNDQLQNLLTSRNLPSKPNQFLLLSNILIFHDMLDPDKLEDVQEDYSSWTVNKLKTEIGSRSLDISKPKSQLITLLMLSDECIAMNEGG